MGIANDIVVYGKTEKEHDENLRRMMQRCHETGLKLNPEKGEVKKEEIKFFGVIISKDGVKPDPRKVSALKDMAPPSNFIFIFIIS